MLPVSGKGHEALDDFGLGLDAEGFVLQFSILEEEQGGNVADSILDGEIGLLIDIDFDDLDGAAFFGGNFVEDRAQHFAGTAPLGPEINHHGDGGLENFGSKSGFGDLGDCSAGHKCRVGVGMSW